jgi:osmotically inducible lipoprotein OsmB
MHEHDPAAAGNGERRIGAAAGAGIAAIAGGSGWTGAAVGAVVGGVAGNIKGSKQQ